MSRYREKTGCYEARRKEEEVQRKDRLPRGGRREEEGGRGSEEEGGRGAEKRPVAMTGGLRKEEEVQRKDWLQKLHPQPLIRIRMCKTYESGFKF